MMNQQNVPQRLTVAALRRELDKLPGDAVVLCRDMRSHKEAGMTDFASYVASADAEPARGLLDVSVLVLACYGDEP